MKIIYLLLDAISYEHSWLNDSRYMPNLKKISSKGINFHNHFSVTHNTRGNLAAMLYGASSSVTGVMGRKQSFRDSGLKSLQVELKENEYFSSYIGTQPLFQGEKINDKLDFDECLYLSPSMSDFYIPAENFNSYLSKKIKILNKNSLTFLHYTDCHEPYETPDNCLSKKDFPHLHKFHYRLSNLLFRIPRQIYRNYFSIKNLYKRKKAFHNYHNLEKLCNHPFGPISNPERYSWFYENVWKNELFYNEYKKMMTVTLKYIDKKIMNIINFIKENHSENSLIFISSDHGNNGILSPKFKEKEGVLSDSSTHIPLSIITFDQKLQKSMDFRRDIFNFTSHTNFYKTILNLINPHKYRFENSSLLSKSIDNKFVLSEINDARLNYGECIIRNNEKKIKLRISKSDDIKTLRLIKIKDIKNSISEEDYNIYLNFKKDYNSKYF